jgi:HTH-type transcriptional regulator/antitoxin HigA
MNSPTDLKTCLKEWRRFSGVTGIAPIHDDEHYKHMASLLNALLEDAKGDEAHPSMALIDIIGDLIADYEATLPAMPEATGVEALRFLMEQHHLTQRDLPEIGTQGVVSEILSGKRDLNVRQIRALSERFAVSSATFV